MYCDGKNNGLINYIIPKQNVVTLKQSDFIDWRSGYNEFDFFFK
jgi:hypothetical protein